MAIWTKPSGVEIDMPDDFDAKALRAIGWTKKRTPSQPPQQQPPYDHAVHQRLTDV